MSVGKKIKELREQHGMSQVELADKMDVSKQTLYKYENDIITNIPSDKIEIAAKIFNVSPAYLMGWEQQPTNENKRRYILTDEELAILKAFRDATPEMRRIAAYAIKYEDYLRENSDYCDDYNDHDREYEM